eukprot:EG_transcript_20213
MTSAAPLLALLSLLGLLGVVSVVDGGGPPAVALRNGTGVNPDIAVFAPSGIDFMYINMNRSVHRRRNMERQLRAARIPATRWPGVAVPADSVDVVLGMRGTPGYPKTKNNWSPRQYANTVGCRRSHVSAVAHWLAYGQPGSWHMLFEDDVSIPANLFRAALPLLRQVPGHWDVIRFDCWGIRYTHPSFFDVVAPSVYRVHLGGGCNKTSLNCWFCGGAHAVLYRHDSLPRVLKAIHDLAGSVDYDCLLSEAGQPHGPLHSYCIQLGSVNPGKNFSSDRLSH